MRPRWDTTSLSPMVVLVIEVRISCVMLVYAMQRTERTRYVRVAVFDDSENYVWTRKSRGDMHLREADRLVDLLRMVTC